MPLIHDQQRQRIIRHHRDTGPAWLERLPDLVATYRRRWRLSIELPGFADGAAGWAAPVRLADETEAVLKIGLPGRDPVDLAAAWRAYGSRGLARLFAYDAADHAFLIERCRPGTPAVRLTPFESDEIATRLLPKLWAPVPDLDLPHLSSIAATRGPLLRERAVRLGVELYDTCAELFDELAATTPAEVLLHGDFHPNNVLLSARGWLAIDPRPMVGERAYDLAIHLHHQLHTDPDPVGRVGRLADRLAIPPSRALRWTAAKIIQLWSWRHDTGSRGSAATPNPGDDAATARLLLAAL